jgi:hypothetical protein
MYKKGQKQFHLHFALAEPYFIASFLITLISLSLMLLSRGFNAGISQVCIMIDAHEKSVFFFVTFHEERFICVVIRSLHDVISNDERTEVLDVSVKSIFFAFCLPE